MNGKESSRKIYLFITLAVVAICAMVALWLNMVIKRSWEGEQLQEKRTDPDHYAYNFTYIQMLPNGTPQYMLTGDKLTHYPEDDSFRIDKPHFVSLEEDKPPQTADSQYAFVKKDYTEIHMHGNAVLNREKTATSDAVRLTSDYLLIYPNDEVIQTDKAFVLKREKSTLSGIGMYANNAAGIMRVYEKAKLISMPKGQQ